MSLEEKAGQLLMVCFRGESANEHAQALIQDTKVGGIIYYNWANGLHSPEQVRLLSEGLQQLAAKNRVAVPLLIAVDQEGGIVSRLQNGFTSFPGNKALGMTGEPDLAEAAASVMGREMLAVGVNMNLAPVVDVDSNPRNPIIGVRAFGNRPEVVIAYGAKALSGYAKAGVISTLKHFPGHGDVEIDSHEALPLVSKSQEELEECELLPFAKLAASADAIMTAHIMVPALDSDNCSTLSEKTLAYLRESIGFQGVIVADSLVMEGVLQNGRTVDEAAIQALKAGCDILLLGGRLLNGEQKELATADVQRIHSSIVRAVKEGRVSEARLNQAVAKILHLKKRYAAVDPHALSQKIASLALQVIEKESIASLDAKKLLIVAPQVLQSNIGKTSLLHIGQSTEASFFMTLNPSDEETETINSLAEDADVLVFCSYNAWKNQAQAALIQSLLDTGKPVILIVARDPLDASLFPNASLIFSTFSPTASSIEAVCDQLVKQ